MGFLKLLFRSKKRLVTEYLKNGALILDVRTQREWDNGHIENSLHIPLNQLDGRIDEVKQLNKPIIACCQSGVRSAKAAKVLKLNNINAINGGGWVSVKNHL